MKVNYRRLLLRLFFWFTAEIILGYLGLDNLADYSEYLKEQSATYSVVSSYWV